MLLETWKISKSRHKIALERKVMVPTQLQGNVLELPSVPDKTTWSVPQKQFNFWRNQNNRLFQLCQNGQGWAGVLLAPQEAGGQRGDHQPEELLWAQGKYQGPLCATLFTFCRICYVCLAGRFWDVFEREFFMLSELIISHGQVAIEHGEITIQGRGTTEHLSS